MESKFGKIVLVVIGVILMITFLLPAGVQQFAGQPNEVGEVDGQPVTRQQVATARALLQYANLIQIEGLPLPVVALAGPALQQADEIAAAFGPEQAALVLRQVVADASDRARSLQEDELTFFLLLREAELGGGVPLGEIERQLEANARVRLPDERGELGAARVVPFRDVEGERLRENYLRAAKAILDVATASRQYGSAVKVSRPVAEQVVAATRQSFTLSVLPVPFDSFIATVDEPSDQAAQEQFDAYADTAPGSPTLDNPFGFGYRRPDRVSFDYLSIGRGQARDAVVAELLGQPLAEREVELFRIFRGSRDRYATTRPATRPATRPGEEDLGNLLASDPSVDQFLQDQAALLSGEELATWRAFTANHDDVLRDLVTERTNQRLARAAERAEDRLAADFRRARVAGDDGASAQALTSAEYLDQVAAAVAEDTGVTPQVVRPAGGELLAVSDLASPVRVGAIAGAVLARTRFADLVAQQTLDLLNEEGKERAIASGVSLEPLRPGPPLLNAAGDAFVFRLLQAEPSAPPASLAEVRDEVLADLRRVAAFGRAVEVAEEKLTDAGLAPSGDEIVRTLGPIVPLSRAQSDVLTQAGLPANLSDAERTQLAEEIIRVAGTQGRVGVLRLPLIGYAVAASVEDVTPQFETSVQRSRLIVDARDTLSRQVAQQRSVVDAYFDAEQVRRRTGFEADD